ncbi:peptide deformylase [Embleya sp. NPDC001921]
MTVRVGDSADVSRDRRTRVQGEPVDHYPPVPPEAVRGTLRRITTAGEEILRRRCREVVEFGTSDLSRLIDDMFATNRVAEGVGLAANQVDVDMQVFVWDITDEWGVRHVGHVANPVLEDVPVGQRTLVDAPKEGCLSVPGAGHRAVPRLDRVVMRGRDKDGASLVIDARGYLARCVQHEIDHLHGHLYVDRLPARERKAALREMDGSQHEVFARRAALAEQLGK